MALFEKIENIVDRTNDILDTVENAHDTADRVQEMKQSLSAPRKKKMIWGIIIVIVIILCIAYVLRG